MITTQEKSRIKSSALSVLRTFQAEIVLGNPRQRCAGTGICKLHVLPRRSADACNCPVTPAVIDVLADRALRFRFQPADLRRAQERAAFASGVFRIFCPVAVPEPVGACYEKGEALFLKPGAYAVFQEANGAFSVLISLAAAVG